MLVTYFSQTTCSITLKFQRFNRLRNVYNVLINVLSIKTTTIFDEQIMFNFFSNFLHFVSFLYIFIFRRKISVSNCIAFPYSMSHKFEYFKQQTFRFIAHKRLHFIVNKFPVYIQYTIQPR